MTACSRALLNEWVNRVRCHLQARDEKVLPNEATVVFAKSTGLEDVAVPQCYHGQIPGVITVPTMEFAGTVDLLADIGLQIVPSVTGIDLCEASQNARDSLRVSFFSGQSVELAEVLSLL